MVLFAVTLVVALLGVGAYDLYNPGPLDVSMAGYHFVAVPSWEPVALGAAVPLSFFLVHALWVAVRIRLLKSAGRRASAWEPFDWPPAEEPPPLPVPAPGVRRRRSSQAPTPPVGPQPAPKRSWLTHRD